MAVKFRFNETPTISTGKNPAKAALRILTALVVAALATGAGAAQLMTRALKEKPAVVLTAFGTSTRAKATYDILEAEVRKKFPDHEVRWAFTSEVIRERVNARNLKDGKPDRLKSLQQVLADLEAEGYLKTAVQPVHIFPGEEYEEVLAVVKNFPGLKIETGETLMQRWETMFSLVRELSADFLKPEEGANVLVAHGTPMTNVGSNIAYMGLDRHLRMKYKNVWLAGVDGVADRETALSEAAKWPVKRVRFIPFMYVGGDHIMNDVMGEDKAGEDVSWKGEMEKAGFAADAPTAMLNGEKYYKGLGFLPGTVKVFLGEIERSLSRL